MSGAREAFIAPEAVAPAGIGLAGSDWRSPTKLTVILLEMPLKCPGHTRVTCRAPAAECGQPATLACPNRLRARSLPTAASTLS